MRSIHLGRRMGNRTDKLSVIEFPHPETGKEAHHPDKDTREYRMIIDSGSSGSSLPHAMAEAFHRAFVRVAGVPYEMVGNANGYSQDQLALLPTIEYVMAGILSTSIFFIYLSIYLYLDIDKPTR